MVGLNQVREERLNEMCVRVYGSFTFLSVRCARAERTRTRRTDTASAGSTLLAKLPTTAPTMVVGSCGGFVVCLAAQVVGHKAAFVN